MNSNIKGSLIELKVQIKLMEKGYTVFTPVADGSEIDLIAVDKNGITIKIQIKSSKGTKVGFRVDTRKCLNVARNYKTSYNDQLIDYFAFIFNDSLYMIPYNIVIEKIINLQLD